MALLARREYARAELAVRLAGSGAPRSEVETVLDELAAAGLLSDTRFAAALVQQKTGAYSKRAIAYALRGKGVSASDASDALAAIDGAEDIANAQALWQRRFGRPPADEREKARQLRFLLSRGYSHAVAFKVLRLAGAPVDDEAS